MTVFVNRVAQSFLGGYHLAPHGRSPMGGVLCRPSDRRTPLKRGSRGVSDPPYSMIEPLRGPCTGGRSRPAVGPRLFRTCWPTPRLTDGPSWLPLPALLRAGHLARPHDGRTAPLTFGRTVPMALIKPRTRGKRLVRHRTRLDWQTNETLYAYAHFLGEPTEYVINQVIDTVLGKDKDFLLWRADHPASFVPRHGAPAPNGRPRPVGPTLAPAATS